MNQLMDYDSPHRHAISQQSNGRPCLAKPYAPAKVLYAVYGAGHVTEIGTGAEAQNTDGRNAALRPEMFSHRARQTQKFFSVDVRDVVQLSF